MDNQLFWNRLARRYDGFMRRFAPDYPALVQRIIVDLAESQRVIEVAAGTGIIALELARNKQQVAALDMAPAMVTAAQAKARHRNLAHIQFVVGSAYSLPWPDHSFDAVVSANSLHVMTHPDLAVREMHRVIKPNGRLVVPTYCHAETKRARLLSGGMHLFGFKVYARFTVAGFVEFIRQQGFAVDEAETSSEAIPLCYLIAHPT